MLSPLKNRATSWSDACHGSPLALTIVSSSTKSEVILIEIIVTNLDKTFGHFLLTKVQYPVGQIRFQANEKHDLQIK